MWTVPFCYNIAVIILGEIIHALLSSWSSHKNLAWHFKILKNWPAKWILLDHVLCILLILNLFLECILRLILLFFNSDCSLQLQPGDPHSTVLTLNSSSTFLLHCISLGMISSSGGISAETRYPVTFIEKRSSPCCAWFIYFLSSLKWLGHRLSYAREGILLLCKIVLPLVQSVGWVFSELNI